MITESSLIEKYKTITKKSTSQSTHNQDISCDKRGGSGGLVISQIGVELKRVILCGYKHFLHAKYCIIIYFMYA